VGDETRGLGVISEGSYEPRDETLSLDLEAAFDTPLDSGAIPHEQFGVRACEVFANEGKRRTGRVLGPTGSVAEINPFDFAGIVPENFVLRAAGGREHEPCNPYGHSISRPAAKGGLWV
jgi:hypothetical protein